jgi:hypothetical protein
MSASIDHSYVDMDVESGEKTFTIRNKGFKPLRIVSVSQENQSFHYTPSLTDIIGTVIEPDGAYTVTSKVQLDKQGQQSDTVTITASGLTEEIDPDRASSWTGSSRMTAVAIVTDATLSIKQNTSLGFKDVSTFTFPSIKLNETKTLKVYLSKKSGKFPLKISSVTPVSVSSIGWDVTVSSGKLYTSTTSIGGAFTGSTLRLPRLFDKTTEVAEYTITVKGKAPSEALRGRIDIVSNAGGKTGTTSISLSGSMSNGETSLYRTGQGVESEYNFGTIARGSSKTVSFTIENIGGYYNTVDIIKMSTSSTGASTYSKDKNDDITNVGTVDFGFELQGLPSTPFTLAPGEKKTFNVKVVNNIDTIAAYSLSLFLDSLNDDAWLFVYSTVGGPNKMKIKGKFTF